MSALPYYIDVSLPINVIAHVGGSLISRLVGVFSFFWITVGVWYHSGNSRARISSRVVHRSPDRSCILATCEPKSVFAIDRSEGFLAEAQGTINDRRVRFDLADASALPWASASCDATVSGLVLNFVPDTVAMTKEMVRVTRPGGRIAAYVWDYSGGMQMMRHFWDAAIAVNPEDAALDQAERFPLCQPDPLRMLFREAGLSSLTVQAIDIPTVFRDFDDYWTPFLGKQGAAPTYLASLDTEKRVRIRAVLRSRLVPSASGSIALSARVWAIQGTV
jgi:SAM-dependent methyltransferase